MPAASSPPRSPSAPSRATSPPGQSWMPPPSAPPTPPVRPSATCAWQANGSASRGATTAPPIWHTDRTPGRCWATPCAIRPRHRSPRPWTAGFRPPAAPTRRTSPNELSRMTTHPTTAMVLAAGLGTRMRPLTDATAKPLLPLGGRPLIDHTLDHLAAAGVQTVVVNALWQADRLATHLAGRTQPRIILRRETTLLDTGGGVRAALDQLGDAPFYVVNGDAFWLNGPRPALTRLAEAFEPGRL